MFIFLFLFFRILSTHSTHLISVSIRKRIFGLKFLGPKQIEQFWLFWILGNFKWTLKNKQVSTVCLIFFCWMFDIPLHFAKWLAYCFDLGKACLGEKCYLFCSYRIKLTEHGKQLKNCGKWFWKMPQKRHICSFIFPWTVAPISFVEIKSYASANGYEYVHQFSKCIWKQITKQT